MDTFQKHNKCFQLAYFTMFMPCEIFNSLLVRWNVIPCCLHILVVLQQGTHKILVITTWTESGSPRSLSW
jgi:hypothetical protein